ncbi:MAG: hypothetical protein ACPG7X_07300 [Flavobacteriaceae bacterium]
MLSLLRTFLGALFFLCCLGVIVIKNHPSHYQIKIHQKTTLPWAGLVAILNSQNSREGVDNAPLLLTDRQQLPTKNNEVVRFALSSTNYFEIKEEWQWDETRQSILLHYTYKLNFLSKLLSMFNATHLEVIRLYGLERLSRAQDELSSKLNQHRWDYMGEQTLPLTYYLAYEGDSTWDELTSSIDDGYNRIRTFAAENNIELKEDEFVLYPSMGENQVRWRAAISVDRFYRTNNLSIRCRRYRGGKALGMIHKGTNLHLKKSWTILNDSLKRKRQNYPLIQKKEITVQESKNPLDWTTTLFAPIQ